MIFLLFLFPFEFVFVRLALSFEDKDSKKKEREKRKNKKQKEKYIESRRLALLGILANFPAKSSLKTATKIKQPFSTMTQKRQVLESSQTKKGEKREQRICRYIWSSICKTFQIFKKKTAFIHIREEEFTIHLNHPARTSLPVIPFGDKPLEKKI